jgi:hypothetical protein
LAFRVVKKMNVLFARRLFLVQMFNFARFSHYLQR